MKFFWIEFLRGPEDGGGTGGAAAPAAAAGAPDGSAAASGGVSPPPAAAAPPPAATAPAASTVPAAVAPTYNPYWPDGLDPAFKGADEKTTMDNIAKSMKGYRDRDAKAGRPPETPEGYLDFSKVPDFKIDDAQKPYFDNLANDPAFKTMAAAAHKHGMSQAGLLETYQAGLNAMAEAGLLEPIIDPAVEKAALVPEAARGLPEADQKLAVEKRISENFAFLDLMAQNKGLPKEASDYAQMMLGDSAKGHAFIEWAASLVNGGGGGQPGNIGQPGGGVTRESVRAEMAALQANPNDPDYGAKSRALDEKYKRLFQG